LNNGDSVVFQRLDSGWTPLYTSPSVTISSYSASHTEPPPTPTPTPVPTYTFTFHNNYQAGNHFILYLNTDGDSSTGYVAGGGAEYLIQDNGLHQYTGDGSSWSWSGLSCSSLTFSAGSTTTWTLSQACLPALNNGDSVVFQRLNSGWSSQYTSPSVTISSYAASHTEPPPTPTPTPVPTYNFTFTTNNYQTGNHFILYLNTDGDSSTGYVAGGGAEYSIQDNDLYQYTGDGSSWNWSGPLSCSSLTFSAGSTTTWTLSQACLSALNNGDSVVFQRLSSGWSPLYTSPSVTISSYSASHIESSP
jgi:hypothetical protein